MNPFAVTVRADVLKNYIDKWSNDMLCLIDELIKRSDDRFMVRCDLEDLSEVLLMKQNIIMHMLKKMARRKLLAYSKAGTALTIALNEDIFRNRLRQKDRKAEREDMKISDMYKTDMTFNDVVEQLSSLIESIKQTNANIERISKDIEELKEQISHLNQ